MKEDSIICIEIDHEGKLHLITKKEVFPMIYRLAKGIGWNSKKHSLFSNIPLEWTYEKWYKHICNIVKINGNCSLSLNERVEWINIPDDIKEKIKNL